jgi:DNA-binding IclR family transcriptional regulator
VKAASDTDYSVRAVERAVNVLTSLAEADGPRTLSTVAAEAGLSVPTTFRLLRTLEAQGLAMQDDAGRYTLGFRVLELANALVRQLDVVAIARPFLGRARDAVDETVGLVVRSGDFWVPVAYAEATQQVRRVMHLGERTPLYADSTGKVLLAHDTDRELDEYLARTELVPLSPTTVTDPAVLRDQIRIARARGYATSVNERGAGGAGAAAPVRGHDGRVVAAVLAAVPASRFSGELRKACIETTVATARDISEAIGFSGDRARRAAAGRSASTTRITRNSARA